MTTSTANLPVSPVSRARLPVAFGAAALFALWTATRFDQLTNSQNGLIRFFLCVAFAILLMLRRKHIPRTEAELLAEPFYHFLVGMGSLLAVVTGTLLAILGIIFSVSQMEWIGLMLVLLGCWEWALPPRFALDTLRALILLYWAHPVPGPLFQQLQIMMQHASVSGTEWLLHMLNVRVWADGLVLRTGITLFEVPAWCSGMRTASTVFILSIGLTFLMRLSWFSGFLLVSAALGQALMLNVLRIATMVLIAPRMPSLDSIEFLHDSTGILVLGAVLLTYVEARAAEHARGKKITFRAELNAEWIQRLSEYPPIWRKLVEYKGLLLTLLAGALIAAGLAYKTRPFHRAQMIMGVVDGLRDSGQLESAQRAANEVGRLVPEDREWQRSRVGILLIRGRYEEVLRELAKLRAESSDDAIQLDILEAYALMGLGRMEDATEIAYSLPEQVQREDPRVAMILAEMGLYHDEPERISRHIVTAARWHPNLARIRSLYPYLRAHRQWDAILESDASAPHHRAGQALAATEAAMNMNQTAKVASMALHAMEAWPYDVRVLEPLYFMAMKRREGPWEQRFSEQFLRCLSSLDTAAEIYRLLDKCFALGRPDLAWAACRRLEQVAPGHPYLELAVVYHGPSWFSFRRQFLGFSAGDSGEHIEMQPYYHTGRLLANWRTQAEWIPFGKELSVADVTNVRKAALARAIVEFRRRRAAGRLSAEEHYEYIFALEIDGQMDAVTRELDFMMEAYPRLQLNTTVVRSEIQERAADWQGVYETLRTYTDRRERDIALSPLLRLARAQLHLRLGLAAQHTSRLALSLYPRSPLAAELRTLILSQFGAPDEALFVLMQPRPRHQRTLDILEARLLMETQRYSEAEAFCRSALLPPFRIPEQAPQALQLPLAEGAVLWHYLAVPNREEFAHTAEILQRNQQKNHSPFLRNLTTLWLAAYEEASRTTASSNHIWTLAQPTRGIWSPARWQACGRDAVERATALNQLTLFLCAAGEYDAARRAAQMAVEQAPAVGRLWRYALGLSGVPDAMLEQAETACPHDPELWLAGLVAITQKAPREDTGPPPAGLQERLARHADVPVETVVRAGEYLLRGGMTEAAIPLGRAAQERARGLLPAYVFALKCAILDADRDWALRATRLAIQHSLRPLPPLYRRLVALRSIDRIEQDGDMIDALKVLRDSDPANTLWAQMLGYIRFQRGGWEIVDAMYQMTAAVDAGATNRIPYMIAADASRRIGNTDRAAGLLRQALEHFPGDAQILNNLAYTLAAADESLDEALVLAAELAEHAGEDMRMLDTLAYVYVRAGQTDKAEAVLRKLQDLAPEDSPESLQAEIRQAEVALLRNRPREAGRRLAMVLQQSRKLPDEMMLYANRLDARIQIKINELEQAGHTENILPGLQP